MASLEPTWIDVTWGAGGSTSARTLEIASNTQKYCGVDVMMHLTCTNLSRSKLREILVDAKEAGIQNILALRGDPVRGTTWTKHPDGFEHAVELVRFIREEFGDYFCIGVGGYPEGWSGKDGYEQDLAHLKAKVDAGADIVLTQLFYDASAYGKFLTNCKRVGINCPVVPGIMPIQSFKAFKSMTKYCKCTVPERMMNKLRPLKDDDAAVREVGIDIMIDFCRECLQSGAPGLHFYTLNLERSVRQIISGLDSVSVLDPGKMSRDPSMNNLQDLVDASADATKPALMARGASNQSLPTQPSVSATVDIQTKSTEDGSSRKFTSVESNSATFNRKESLTRSPELAASQSPKSSLSLAPELRVDARNSSRRRLPWRPSTMAKREKEDVRPIFWANRPKSYVERTEAWDEYPNGRWGDHRSPAFGELADSHFYNLVAADPEDQKAEWGEAPLEETDIWQVFARYVEGRCSKLPWCAEPLQLETVSLINRLSALNQGGILTINSQPRLNGVHSDDPVYGWGGSGGVVYQKAYLEFFCSAEKWSSLRTLIETDKTFASLTYHATNHDGSKAASNCTTRGTAAVTWGVFPGREVIQPTVVDPEAFMVWKDEAFSLWLRHWAVIYDDESVSYELIHKIHDTYFLVNLVDNDFLRGVDFFSMFERL